ncbi:aminotransferase class I/II-fold pyridoxal phosphate-dependent enzyme [Streptococcus dentasini]
MFLKAAERMSGRGDHFLANQQEIIKRLREKGKEVIDLGRGNPDQPTLSPIVDHFQEDAKLPSNFGYPPYGGKTSFKAAIRDFYKEEYGVELLLDEITVFSGSLAALTALPMVLANPGDSVLVPDPAFFGYEAGVRMAGAQTIKMALTAENNYLPDLDRLDREILAKTKLMFLNYPHNPTGAGATREFFDQAVAFAKHNNIAVVHDFAYADISFDTPSPSFFAVPGGKISRC